MLLLRSGQDFVSPLREMVHGYHSNLGFLLAPWLWSDVPSLAQSSYAAIFCRWWGHLAWWLAVPRLYMLSSVVVGLVRLHPFLTLLLLDHAVDMDSNDLKALHVIWRSRSDLPWRQLYSLWSSFLVSGIGIETFSWFRLSWISWDRVVCDASGGVRLSAICTRPSALDRSSLGSGRCGSVLCVPRVGCPSDCPACSLPV